ncbi:class I SAM-dependent methyltransferase [Idiomarina aquatica]|uniref:Methyltransferase domain-containing protein n=1 Tax=Idiomarina aquatica TaxID=1327752 RepID=A0AA94EGQ6_9GAMM|nr:class I SAM-dependent methyltransferase [Idiomarina aquatica]RUO45191.1 hypothetical protein CWE23_04010 [Idiomarina aquatica]
MPPKNHEINGTIESAWYVGDWKTLHAECGSISSSLSAQSLMKLAVACYQYGDFDTARCFIGKGSTAPSSAQYESASLVLGGIYNSLAKANYLADHVDIAEHYFQLSSSFSFDFQFSKQLSSARIQNQKEQLTNEVGYDINFMIHERKLANKSLKLDSIDQLLGDAYAFLPENNVWARLSDDEFGYSDGDAIEQRILDAVKSCNDVSVFSSELLPHQTDWPSEYHLSADRTNLLRPFVGDLAGASVLELGCGCGAITRFLGEHAGQVVAVEGSIQRATIAAERCRDLKNVTIIQDKLQDVPFEAQFDVVTLIGVLEYSQIYVDADDPIHYVLQRALTYLKPGGQLIVAIENQLGLKYFAGAPEDHGVGLMAGINDTYGENTPITFGRKELEKRIKKAGFSSVQTHLSLPDYKLPSLIVHPAGYNNENFELGSLLANTAYYDRQGIANPLFSLESAWDVISRNGLSADLANSFLMFARKDNGTNVPPVDESPSDILSSRLASYYSPKRTQAASQEIVFTASDRKIDVNRRKVSSDWPNNDFAVEDYVHGRLHSQLVHQALQRKDWQITDLIDVIDIWVSALERDLLEVTSIELPDEQHAWQQFTRWLPKDYLDAVPRNLVVGNNNSYTVFIDLEWSFEHELPFELVLYRGLIITLTTITSIAKPADDQLISKQALLNSLLKHYGIELSEALLTSFATVMENLSRRAQGLTLVDHEHVQKIRLGDFKVRDLQASQQRKNAEATLYWCRKDEGFSEDKTVKRSYRLNEGFAKLSFELPKDNAEIRRLRLDFAGIEGCFIVDSIAISGNDGQPLWLWSHSIAELKHLGHLEVFNNFEDEKQQTCFISIGHDPQFELILNDDALNRLNHERQNGECVLQLRLKAFG